MAPEKQTFERAIIILADGARPDVLESLVKRGDLPNISRYLVERGSYRHGVTTFPSTTGPAYMPFLTGALPATCNVPGIRWLDRKLFGQRSPSARKHRSYVGIDTFRFNRDIDPSIQTVFDIIPASYTIFNMITRGAGHRNLTKICRIWYWYYAHLTDHWGFVDRVAEAKMLAAIRREFSFLFVVFPGVDEYSHFSSPFSEPVMDAYRQVDHAVGELMKELGALGKDEDTMVWIVSDHGLSATHTHFCLNTFLENRGIKTFYYPLVFRKKGCRAASMVSGNGMSHLYFSHNGKWGESLSLSDLNRWYPHVIDELLAEEAIDLLALKNDDGSVLVRTKSGRVSFSMREQKVTCHNVEGDPLGYGELYRQLDECDQRQALHLTIDTLYPDLPYQLSHLFMSPRCGDVVVSAKPGFDLRVKYESPEHKASHGSIHRDHMLVPVVTNYPFKENCVRTVDLYSTILSELGYQSSSNVDGMLLV